MLPNDITRCAGRRDLTPDTAICPVRNTCERYRSALSVAPSTEPAVVSTAIWLCVSDTFEQRIPTCDKYRVPAVPTTEAA